jgi:hypothetical protein
MDIGEEIERVANVLGVGIAEAALLLGLLRSLRMVGETKEEIMRNMVSNAHNILTYDAADYDIMKQLDMDQNDYQLWLFELLLENYHLYPTEQEYQRTGTDPRAFTATDILERKVAMHGQAAQGSGYGQTSGFSGQARQATPASELRNAQVQAGLGYRPGDLGAGAASKVPGAPSIAPTPPSPIMQMAAEAQSIASEMLSVRELLDKFRGLLYQTDPRDTKHLGYATEVSSAYTQYCQLADRLYHLTSGGANG